MKNNEEKFKAIICKMNRPTRKKTIEIGFWRLFTFEVLKQWCKKNKIFTTATTKVGLVAAIQNAGKVEQFALEFSSKLIS